MTARALFRFTGPEKSQFACVEEGGAWLALNHGDFLAANGTGGATLWDGLQHLSHAMIDLPELDTALGKVREYLGELRPIRDKIASYKRHGILADEAELLGKIAEIHARIVSMYLAKVVKLYRGNAGDSWSEVAAVVGQPAVDADASGDLKAECTNLLSAIVDRVLPEELTDPMTPADTQTLAREMIRDVFEPKGRLRERGRRDPARLAEIVGLASLPTLTKGRRHNVAPILVEMLEHANLVGFEPDLGEANWPRLSARARRGTIVS